MSAPATTPLDGFAKIAAERFRRGRVVPFLGAGVNLAGRPPHTGWTRGTDLPSGAELAGMWADRYGYPEIATRENLMRVSQFVEARVGETAVYEDLREVVTDAWQPSVVHGLLARVPALLRAKGVPEPNLLVVTTNYDDGQEQAFDAAGEAYDVVW